MYNRMRLTTAQRETIVDAFRKTFSSGARLFLFGSRTAASTSCSGILATAMHDLDQGPPLSADLLAQDNPQLLRLLTPMHPPTEKSHPGSKHFGEIRVHP